MTYDVTYIRMTSQVAKLIHTQIIIYYSMYVTSV